VDELPWEAAGWRARAERWIGGRIDALGLEPAGPVEDVKFRPWSAVLRTPTSGGDLYFKANLPALANEPELTRLLHRICPDRVLGVLADEPDEGWMLQADGGPVMASRLEGAEVVSGWEGMLRLYADVQVRAAGHVGELLDAGAPDRRLPQLGRLLEELGTERHAHLAGLVGDLAAELDGRGLPASIDHSDLNAWNVLAPGDRYVFFDWHEASVTHPFFSMVVATRALAHTHGVEPGSADGLRLRDAYLDAWAGYGSPESLRAALDLALRIGPLTRALAWARVLEDLPRSAAAEYADYVPGWLDDLQDELERA
jgi:hypothetical protein